MKKTVASVLLAFLLLAPSCRNVSAELTYKDRSKAMTETPGALTAFMDAISANIEDAEDFTDDTLLPSWNNDSKMGVFVHADDSRDVIWVNFMEDDSGTLISEDLPDAQYSAILLYALDKDADLFSRYVPFVLMADDPTLDYEQAAHIADTCFEEGSYENGHALYRHGDIEGVAYFNISLSSKAVPSPEPLTESGTKPREYSLWDGKMSLAISEDDFDVFEKDNSDNQLALERQGLSQDKVDTYMVLTGYELKAIPVGESLGSAATEIIVNLKPDKYEGLGSLSDLSQEEKDAIATLITSSFPGVEDYEWYTTDAADYFVFDTKMISQETRYATIIDGCMVYIFLSSQEEEIDEAMRSQLREIIDTVTFS